MSDMTAMASKLKLDEANSIVTSDSDLLGRSLDDRRQISTPRFIRAA